MIPKRKIYAKNKMGKFNRKSVVKIADEAMKEAKRITTSKQWENIKDKPLWSFFLLNKRVYYVDTMGKKRRTEIMIFLSRSFEQHFGTIEGQFNPDNGYITVNVNLGTKFNKRSKKQLIKIRDSLNLTLYHEIAHAIREIDVGTKEIKKPDIDIMTVKYYRHPLELDANISSVINFMRDHAKTNDIKINTELFWFILRQFTDLQEAYSTPKWRKIIIKRLHREGIDIK